jgi:hypothetical protein
MKTQMYFKALLFLFLTISVASCGDDDDPIIPVAGNSITDIASRNSDFTILVSALSRAGLAATLDGQGHTLFLPQPTPHSRHSSKTTVILT